MQEYLCISGGQKLNGEVRVAGAKNAALPLIIASLLTSEPVTLKNIPDLEDIAVLIRMLRSFGASAQFSNGTVNVSADKITSSEAPYSLVKLLRASFWVLGPLLARTGHAAVALPGGDAIGTRPVDLHLSGLAQFGANISLKHGVVIAEAPGGLVPKKIRLDYPSVGATHQLLMTAALIHGESEILGAAKEPEIVALCGLLRTMGAKIEGDGTERIVICGKKELGPAEFDIIGDRIEAVTYLSAVASTQGKIRVNGIDPNCLRAVLGIFEESGCIVQTGENWIDLESSSRLQSVSFSTDPFPGVATDVQPLLMAAMCMANGRSLIRETVFESRFGHVAQFRRFGADITIDDRLAIVEGVEKLSAAPVEGLDIRAAAGLVVLGLVSEGITQLSDIYHLDRGYEGLVEKLRKLGANVSRLPAIEAREVVHGC
jgi:UDP-N-acetylglucosamine 1-carboxyvinyltransferase